MTQRTNDRRVEGEGTAANRRVFYDFTISPPKSVSLAAFLGSDERIFAAHERAVRSALREFEAFAATRVRVRGEQSDRLTGDLVAALFTHETSRALDPHLHTHCIVFNATHDPVENRWKALQNHELLCARMFARNVYYHELGSELKSFGYRIRNNARGDFQIDGVPEELCERFSKRHAQIDQGLAKLLAEKPELDRANVQALRARLAETDRARKQKDLSRQDLSVLWKAQLSEVECASLRQLAEGAGSNKVLDRITVCQLREVALAESRLHLKANRELASGARVTNGELVTVKSVRSDGGVERNDGRVLDKSFREFPPGYAVTSYGSQGKTVDYVLFSDSTIKAATNAQQWY
jgi:conjugative relaxase-like TrwC/TraI family protein